VDEAARPRALAWRDERLHPAAVVADAAKDARIGGGGADATERKHGRDAAEVKTARRSRRTEGRRRS
jgi:hypothetical protein